MIDFLENSRLCQQIEILFRLFEMAFLNTIRICELSLSTFARETPTLDPCGADKLVLFAID